MARDNDPAISAPLDNGANIPFICGGSRPKETGKEIRHSITAGRRRSHAVTALAIRSVLYFVCVFVETEITD